ncbi:unnamed protein product [Phyllotreta striolata]|uniref:BESS domain-containing protein n=1 Tax=Phyllotreta striolata TaxID=444603 RepID=A0A9N9TG43_PHYSR|nr:unnamed protein product [Phyllotreta striolata]
MSSSATNLPIGSGDEPPEAARRIATADLIEEVRRHPSIYASNSKAPQQADSRRRSWETAARNLCGGHWKSYGDGDKDTVVKEIQLKWKNLKDNYYRILRKEREEEIQGAPCKKKKYIHYDHLEFLKPFAPSSRSSGDSKEDMEMEGGKNASNIIYIDETNDSEEDGTPSKPVKVHQTTSVTPIAPLAGFGTLQPVQFIQLQSNSGVNRSSDPGDPDGDKLTKVLEKLAKQQEEEKADDPMGNKKFLLSLAPFLRKLPDDVNLEVRLQIMAVIQSYGVKELF